MPKSDSFGILLEQLVDKMFIEHITLDTGVKLHSASPTELSVWRWRRMDFVQLGSDLPHILKVSINLLRKLQMPLSSAFPLPDFSLPHPLTLVRFNNMGWVIISYKGKTPQSFQAILRHQTWFTFINRWRAHKQGDAYLHKSVETYTWLKPTLQIKLI